MVYGDRQHVRLKAPELSLFEKLRSRLHFGRKRLLLFGPATTMAPKLDELRKHRTFRSAFDDLSRLFESRLGWSAANDPLHESTLAPAHRFERNFVREVALQISLYRALTDNGFRFDAVAGVSLGELAAAHAANALDLEGTIRVTCAMVKEFVAADGGDILAVDASEARASLALGGLPATAIIDWPGQSVWAVLDEHRPRVDARFRQFAIAYDMLGTGCMPHTNRVNRSNFIASIGGLAARRPATGFFSSAEGGKVEAPVDSEFWARVCCDPVRFSGMDAALEREEFHEIVYIGSVAIEHRVLSALPPERRPEMKRALDFLPSQMMGR